VDPPRVVDGPRVTLLNTAATNVALPAIEADLGG
jgi:hypothetical protein